MGHAGCCTVSQSATAWSCLTRTILGPTTSTRPRPPTSTQAPSAQHIHHKAHTTHTVSTMHASPSLSQVTGGLYTSNDRPARRAGWTRLPPRHVTIAPVRANFPPSISLPPQHHPHSFTSTTTQCRSSRASGVPGPAVRSCPTPSSAHTLTSTRCVQTRTPPPAGPSTASHSGLVTAICLQRARWRAHAPSPSPLLRRAPLSRLAPSLCIVIDADLRSDGTRRPASALTPARCRPPSPQAHQRRPSPQRACILLGHQLGPHRPRLHCAILAHLPPRPGRLR